ncbi:hypothetical protein ACFX14_010077 [Malus domestica]
MDCCGRNVECPKASLVSGYDPESVFESCMCSRTPRGQDDDDDLVMGDVECSTSEEDGDMSFCIGDAEIRIKRVDSFEVKTVLDLLSFANTFCCDELKAACDSHLASLVCELEDAMLLIDYGLEETAHFLVAACLQVAIEDDMRSNTTVMLLERLAESATESWQKQLAFHLLGVVMLKRKEFKDAQWWFEAAVEVGHIYSLVGIARAKFKHGHKYAAYKQMNSYTEICSLVR